MKLRIGAKEATYVAIEASKREPIRVEAAENGVPDDRAPVAKHLRASASHRLATTSAWRLRVIWKVTLHDCGKHSATLCRMSLSRSCSASSWSY